MALKGIERVRRNYKRTIERIAGEVTHRAVYEILSQGGAAAAGLTPVDTSDLINSQYAPQISQQQGKTSGHIGYTAGYAAAVHDAPGKLRGLPRAPKNRGRGNYWDPKALAEPEFLKKGFDEIGPDIPAILKKHYRID